MLTKLWLLILVVQPSEAKSHSDGTNVADHRVYCIGEANSDKQILTDQGAEYSVPHTMTWRDQCFCHNYCTYVADIEGITTAAEGQKFINELVTMCQKLSPKFKWVQPYFQNDDGSAYLYPYRVANVIYGRLWNLGSETHFAYNDVWDEAGGGFTYLNWNRRNCRYLYDNNELDFDTSLDSKME